MIAIKFFSLNSYDDILMSPYSKIPLTIDENNTLPSAICLKQNPTILTKYHGVVNTKNITHSPQDVPFETCSCGYHARKYIDWKWILCENTFLPHRLFTVVKPHGKIIVHERGVRAQFITLLAIILPTLPYSISPHSLAPRERERSIAHHKTMQPYALSFNLPVLTTEKEFNQFLKETKDFLC